MVLRSLKRAFNALFHFRIWFLLLLPPLITGFILALLFLFFWTPLNSSVAVLLSSWSAMQWLGDLFGSPAVFIAVISSLLLVLLFLPVLFVSVLLVTSIFVTPLVQREVAHKHFKNLEQKRGGSNFGSLWNSLRALGFFVFLFVVTLPLWLIPGLQLVVPALLIIALNKRIFLYDVLQDYASREERKIIEKRYAGGLWGLGALLVIGSYLPLAFIFLPVFSAFAYSFFGLNALEELRSGRATGFSD